MSIKMAPVGLGGRFRVVVSKDAECEQVVEDTGFFDNLITNVGMNRVGEVRSGAYNNQTSFSTLCGRFVVGSGSAVPQFTDTALQNPTAFATSDPQLEAQSSSYERGWSEIIMKHQFEPGQAEGNISEIGIQHTSASGPLWSRTLILDGLGNPTTITVLPNDYLTCYYTLRITIPKEDAVFNIDVDLGDDGFMPTVVTGRPLNTESTESNSGWGLSTINSDNRTIAQLYTGSLIPPTSTWYSGGTTIGALDYPEIAPYVTDSFESYVTYSALIGQVNSQAIGVVTTMNLMGYWQLEFNPPLQKNDTQTMDLTFGYSWARA